MQKEYRWHPQEKRAIRAVFETKGSRILKSAMNKSEMVKINENG